MLYFKRGLIFLVFLSSSLIYAQKNYELVPHLSKTKLLKSDFFELEEDLDFRTFNLLHRPSKSNQLASLINNSFSEKELSAIKVIQNPPNFKKVFVCFLKQTR